MEQQGDVSHEIPALGVEPKSEVTGFLTKLRTMRVWFIFLGFLVVLLAVLLGYVRYSSRPIPSIPVAGEPQVPSIQPQPVTPGAEKIDIPQIANAENKLLFLSVPSTDTYQNRELWMVNADGTNLEKYPIEHVADVRKYPGNTKFVYQTTEEQGKLYLGDLKLGEASEYTPITHSDPAATASFSSLSASPDFNFVVFYTMFIIPCNGADLEGGGPCQPESSEKFREGTYLYDLRDQSTTYLGGSSFPSTWDLGRAKYFYMNRDFGKEGLDEVDLNSKKINRVENATSFGYASYALRNGLYSIKHDANTGASGTQDMSLFEVTNNKTHEKKFVDKGKWSDLQPFVAISPEEDCFLYQKQTYWNNGATIYALYKYDFAAGKVTRVTPESQTEDYNVLGYWLNNQEFLTSRTNKNANPSQTTLVSINTITGQTQELTPKSMHVVSF